VARNLSLANREKGEKYLRVVKVFKGKNCHEGTHTEHPHAFAIDRGGLSELRDGQSGKGICDEKAYQMTIRRC